jgi:hypothetical protein
MPKPNFFLIGAGRSGTTSVYNYLKQHPEVFMSPTKEINFFAYDGESECRQWMGEIETRDYFPVVTMDTYLEIFEGASDETAIGEASVLYLHNPNAARRIRDFAPDARLVAILRHPVDRAYSSFFMHVREGREKRSFMEAIRHEQAGLEDLSLMYPQRHYLGLGLYSRYLLPYFEVFERSRLSIHLYDDLKTDPSGLMRSLFRFLGVSEAFSPDMSRRHNVGGMATNRFWHAFLVRNFLTAAIGKRLPGWARSSALGVQDRVRAKRLVKPRLSAELRRELTEFFRDDISTLEDLIQRDLGSWRQSPSA